MPGGSLKKSGAESKEISGTLCCANNGSANNMTIETHRHNFIGGLPAEFSSTLGSNLFLESRKQPLRFYAQAFPKHHERFRGSESHSPCFRSVRLNSPYRKGTASAEPGPSMPPTAFGMSHARSRSKASSVRPRARSECTVFCPDTVALQRVVRVLDL